MNEIVTQSLKHSSHVCFNKNSLQDRAFPFLMTAHRTLSIFLCYDKRAYLSKYYRYINKNKMIWNAEPQKYLCSFSSLNSFLYDDLTLNAHVSFFHVLNLPFTKLFQTILLRC